jgi:hypothetical protein
MEIVRAFVSPGDPWREPVYDTLHIEVLHEGEHYTFSAIPVDWTKKQIKDHITAKLSKGNYPPTQVRPTYDRDDLLGG